MDRPFTVVLHPKCELFATFSFTDTSVHGTDEPTYGLRSPITQKDMYGAVYAIKY